MAAKTKTQEAPAAPTNGNGGNKPCMTFRKRGVKVSIWENLATTGEGDRKFYKTVTQKIYREGEEWRTTSSLSRDDLPVAQHLLQQAWIWILEAESNKGGEAAE